MRSGIWLGWLLVLAGCSRLPEYPGGFCARTGAVDRSLVLDGGGRKAAAPRGAYCRPVPIGEGYDPVAVEPMRLVEEPGQDASTFSLDVDTAGYANVRRILTQNRQLPPAGAVRIEEMVNYFAYADAPPRPDSPHPLAVHVEVGECPWNPAHRLVRIGVKGRELPPRARPPCNLVFLIDVSGSMADANKLPLLVESLERLSGRLMASDCVAIVVYAGASGVVLPPTPGHQRATIFRALRRLQAGGSTNGGEGIQLAYRVARENYRPGGNSRVILCTDGDFNVGISDREQLVRLIADQADGGVDLTILGVGQGNFQDGLLEALAGRGNGNYHYLDSQREAEKVLGANLAGTLVTIARDAKIQVFFNPGEVASWRLIGYEDRRLRREDFNDDARDAGELGAGHDAVALYELALRCDPAGNGGSDPNPFLELDTTPPAGEWGRLLLRVRLRYRPPEGGSSRLLEQDVADPGCGVGQASEDFRWSAAVAWFGQLLRREPAVGGQRWDQVRNLAERAVGEDRDGRRREFLNLVDQAVDISWTRASYSRSE